ANYTVISGDTMSGLARLFGTTISQLRAANPQLANDAIYIGQRLHVPGMIEGVTVRPDGPGQETGGTTTPGRTPAPSTTPGSPPAGTPGALPTIPQEFLDAVKLFGNALGYFDQGLGKEIIGELLAAHRLVTGLAKDGPGYADAVALLSLAHQQSKLRVAYFKQVEDWKVSPDNPNRENLMKLQRLTRRLGDGVRAASIPAQVAKMADNLLIACGFSADGSPVTTEQRLLAAKELVGIGKLMGDLRWVLEVGTVLEARYLGTEVVAMINTIRNAAARIGDDVAEQAMKHLTPLLRKAQGQALSLIAPDLVEAFRWFGVELSKSSSRAMIRRGVENVGWNVLKAFKVAGGPAAGLVIEYQLLQARFIADLFDQAGDGISNWVSQGLYGRMFLTVKRDVRAKSSNSTTLFRALFRHDSGDYFLRNGDYGVRGRWLPFARSRWAFPQQLGILPPSLMRRLQDQGMTADPGPLLQEIISTASMEMQLPFRQVESGVLDEVASIATEYLDKVYRDTFERDPPT
nr:LysM peptidoglycan-binding domain-containing protein [Deltaproteobacteria bacterium]